MSEPNDHKFSLKSFVVYGIQHFESRCVCGIGFISENTVAIYVHRSASVSVSNRHMSIEVSVKSGIGTCLLCSINSIMQTSV